VLTATIAPGTVTPTLLAPQNSIPTSAITIKSGTVYATAAMARDSMPLQDHGGAATRHLNFGTGYAAAWSPTPGQFL